MRRLLRWYNAATLAIGFGLLYSTCTYAIRHGNFVLKTDYEICQDLAGRKAELCDLIDWKTTDDFHLGQRIADCLTDAAAEGYNTELCYPITDWRALGWRPESFPIAMPQPVRAPTEVR